jgi:hypothetical protein
MSQTQTRAAHPLRAGEVGAAVHREIEHINRQEDAYAHIITYMPIQGENHGVGDRFLG